MIKKSIKIKTCRICKSQKLKKSFSLGKIAHAGKFIANKSKNITKDFINIVICEKCYLVQLDRNYDLQYLFSNNYGYRSGINKTMRTHLAKLVTKIGNRFSIKKGDKVLDIASNDGTLLKAYNKNIVKVGVDPIANKFKKFYNNIDYKISDFFSSKILINKKLNNFKIVTALAVLYDLPDPNKFVEDMKKILHKDGVIIIEVADLYKTIKNNVFDTFCHEHLEYYSYQTINFLMKKNNLKIFDHEYHDINGGSSRFYVCHKEKKIKISKKINKILNMERREKIFKNETFKLFYKRIKNLKSEFKKLMNELKKSKKIVHGYGASTKGNILIQFYGLSDKEIPFIAERNKQKFNCYTPGSKIKIISESRSRYLKPDYYVVLPWHFKKEILLREKKIRKKGTKFIFPLPKLQIC